MRESLGKKIFLFPINSNRVEQTKCWLLFQAKVHGTGRIFERWKNSCVYVLRSHGTTLTLRKPQTSSRLNYHVNRSKISNGSMWTKWPVIFSTGRKFIRCGVNGGLRGDCDSPKILSGLQQLVAKYRLSEQKGR